MSGGSPRRILAVKLADLGDALTITPALRALHNAWPEATLDVLTSPVGAEALAGLTSIDRLIALDKHQFDRPLDLPRPGGAGQVLAVLSELRRRHYDYLLLMHHLTTRFGTAKYRLLTRAIGADISIGLDNGRGRFLDVPVEDAGFGARHEVDYALAVAERAGGRNAPRRLEMAIDGAAREQAERLLPGHGWVALHVGGGTFSLARRWDAAAFAEAANLLCDRKGLRVALIGTDVDRDASSRAAELLKGEVRDLVGQLSVRLTAAAVERCELLVSNDSGVVHVAAAAGTPVVAIFGPSNDLAWGPYPPEKHRVVRATLPCSPCIYRGKSLGTPQGCATRDCLRLVTPEMVVAAAEELLAAAVAAP